MKDILLDRDEIYAISKKIRITLHCRERLNEYFQKNVTIDDIKTLIRKTPLAWKQSNGQICIMVDEDSYFVCYRYYTYYSFPSFMRKSENGYNTVDKFIFEYKGVKKKFKENERELTNKDCAKCTKE